MSTGMMNCSYFDGVLMKMILSMTDTTKERAGNRENEKFRNVDGRNGRNYAQCFWICQMDLFCVVPSSLCGELPAEKRMPSDDMV